MVRVLGWCGYLHALNLVSLVRAGSCPGWCGYLHALNLVSLVRVSLVGVSLVRAGWCALLVRVVRVLVGSGYLHTLNLVSLVGVSLVRVSWLVWLPARLEPCVLGSCALLVRVLGWFVSLVGVVTCMP